VAFPVRRIPLSLLLAILLTSAAGVLTAGDQAPARTDLDAFMEKVLARREVTRKTLQEYILAEKERFEVLGPGRTPLYRFEREYEWFIREGQHVRSPVRVDGVPIGEADRREYEENWLRRERRRQRDGKDAERGEISTSASVREPDAEPPPHDEKKAGLSPLGQPRFVSEAYFLDFKFEPGHYYLAGRSTLEGREVLEIEYYPTRLFGPDEEKRRKRSEDRDQRAQEINRQMNRTSLVTLWVDPATHQIVKYTFSNVWLDFLPGGWMVRVDDMKASMTMGQPFEGVWLPRTLSIEAGVTLASGSYEARYGREFSNFRQADVKSRIKTIKQGPR
jgi:hypothetical protein